MYSDGIGTKANAEQADKYFKIAFDRFTELEKEDYSNTLQYRLGNMLLNGEGCEKDVSKAVEYLDETNITDILTDVKTFFDDKTCNLVRSMADDHVSRLVSSLYNDNIDIKHNPAYFVGGGTTVLKNRLKKQD
jgi:hypothetical protein